MVDAWPGSCTKQVFHCEVSKRGNAHCLFECSKAAVEFVVVNKWAEKLIGLGCEETNVNIAGGGLRGYLSGGGCPLDCCFLVSGSLPRVVTKGCTWEYFFVYT